MLTENKVQVVVCLKFQTVFFYYIIITVRDPNL
jgi:hypothetical protein